MPAVLDAGNRPCLWKPFSSKGKEHDEISSLRSRNCSLTTYSLKHGSYEKFDNRTPIYFLQLFSGLQ